MDFSILNSYRDKDEEKITLKSEVGDAHRLEKIEVVKH